ncbi:MAG: hypothetical protein ACO1OB_30760 [Archangium sp.]
MKQPAVDAHADELQNTLIIFIIVVTLVVVAVSVFFRVRRLRGHGSAMTVDPAMFGDEAIARRAEAMLNAHDPGFSLSGFDQHVRALLALMQTDGARAWLSDALFLRLRLEREIFGFNAFFDTLSKPLLSVLVVGVDRTNAFESLRARLTFGGDDHVTQEWVLVRRSDANTAAKGLLEHACPGCGAPLQIAETLRCAHCEAVVNSGSHDWVLVDITPGASSLESRTAVVDASSLRALDTALSHEALEDRAALAFWRWREAEHTGLADSLHAVANDQVVQQTRDAHQLGASRERPHAAVFRLRALVVDAEQHALVTASWAAHSPDGVVSHQVVLRLSRPLDARSNSKAGVSTSRCATCLAFIDVSNHRRCRYCEAPLETGWLLTEILPKEELPALLQKARGVKAAAARPATAR